MSTLTADEPLDWDHPGERERAFSRQQQMLAVDGLAWGQCEECGSYALDGRPPVLHERGCSHVDDWREAL